jgi:hypothetical protein
VYCGERRCCHDLTAATAVKAALEVQLADTREALANMTEERDMEQLHARDVASERDALLAEREEERAEQARRDTEYLDEALSLVAELEARTIERDNARDDRERTASAYATLLTAHTKLTNEREPLRASIASPPPPAATPETTCTCGHPRSQHWGNDAHPGCHEPLPPFGDDGSGDTCRCMGFVAAPAPLYYLLSEKWTQGDYITWWRGDSRGYTRRLADAGKYTREEARRIAHYSVIPVRCQEAEALAVRVVALNDDSRKWLRVAVRWKRMLESRWKREHADWPVCSACNGRRGRWDDEAVDQWYPCERCNETGKESPAHPQIVTAPSSSAPIPPGGDRPEECPCCFSEDTPEGADCFCPDWCPEQCEGGEVHRG